MMGALRLSTAREYCNVHDFLTQRSDMKLNCSQPRRSPCDIGLRYFHRHGTAAARLAMRRRKWEFWIAAEVKCVCE